MEDLLTIKGNHVNSGEHLQEVDHKAKYESSCSPDR